MTGPRKPSLEPEVEGAVRTLTRLREKSDEVRAELERMQGELALAERRLEAADAAALREANERLILSSLKAQENAEQCAAELSHVTACSGLDALTSLPNRNVLTNRFAQAIAGAKRQGSRVALLFVDLDNFKEINDSFGHAAGDLVLKQVASCLVGTVRQADTVSRHGGDEFLILLTDIECTAEAEHVAHKVLAALQAAGAASEHWQRLAASIGISIYPEDGDSPDLLIDRADAAMYIAKRRGAKSDVPHGRPVAKGRVARAPGTVALVRALADRPGPASPPTDPLAPLPTPDDLREANGALVRAAIGAQQLQVAAELSLRRQKEYLACVAHELRNPLAPLSVAVSLLRGADPECQAEMQGIIERQVTHMSRLVGDLLDLSRGDTGKLRIHPREVDLSALANDAVAAIRPSMDARAQVFDLTLPAQPFRLVADPVRMVQILSNLLDNASKYTPRGGEIHMLVQVLGDEFIIDVSDNGIGISADSLGAVFEPFAQEQHATGFSGSGLGIGLTVVRELVHLHGGRVVARSKGTGLGSQFIVTLPLAGNGTDADLA